MPFPSYQHLSSYLSITDGHGDDYHGDDDVGDDDDDDNESEVALVDYDAMRARFRLKSYSGR